MDPFVVEDIRNVPSLLYQYEDGIVSNGSTYLDPLRIECEPGPK
jgi:hypothetical protein